MIYYKNIVNIAALNYKTQMTKPLFIFCVFVRWLCVAQKLFWISKFMWWSQAIRELAHSTQYKMIVKSRGVHQTAWLHPNRPKPLAK